VHAARAITDVRRFLVQYEKAVFNLDGFAGCCGRIAPAAWTGISNASKVLVCKALFCGIGLEKGFKKPLFLLLIQILGGWALFVLPSVRSQLRVLNRRSLPGLVRPRDRALIG
jgi:hypothetical protein